jgi:hypothetical protein
MPSENPISTKFNRILDYVFMASSKNFLKAASVHGLKQRFPESCKSAWP